VRRRSELETEGRVGRVLHNIYMMVGRVRVDGKGAFVNLVFI